MLLSTEYRRKLGWSAYFASMTESLENDLQYKRNMTSLLSSQENKNENSYLINEFKKLMKLHKHTYNCSICLEDMNSKNISIITSCGHKFHKNCILKWKETSTKCPHCRTKFSRVL